MFLLGLAVSIAFWPGIIDLATAPRWAVLAVGIPLLLIASLKDPRFERCPIQLAAFGVVVLMSFGLSMLWSPDQLGGLDELLHIMVLSWAVYLGATQPDLSKLWEGVAVGVAVSVGFALLQLAGWQGIPQMASPAGLFGNRNVLAEAGVVAAVALFASPPNRSIRYDCFLLATSLAAVALPMSKNAWAAIVFTVAVALWSRWRALSVLLFSVFAVAATVAMTSSTSGSVRLEIWGPALATLSWFGHGLGSYANAYPLYEFTHSEPIQFMYELGLLSIPIFLFFTRALIRGKHGSAEWYVLIAVLALSLFSFPLHIPLTAFAAAVAAGHLLGAGRRLRSVESYGGGYLGLGA